MISYKKSFLWHRKFLIKKLTELQKSLPLISVRRSRLFYYLNIGGIHAQVITSEIKADISNENIIGEN